jgi:hypothetical protein
LVVDRRIIEFIESQIISIVVEDNDVVADIIQFALEDMIIGVAASNG